MGEFFKPWRRKMGCVTLAMAFWIASVWVTSQSREMTITIYGVQEHGMEISKSTISFSARGISGVRISHMTECGMTYRDVKWCIPYWMMTTSLILISSWLLLIKLRPAHPPA